MFFSFVASFFIDLPNLEFFEERFFGEVIFKWLAPVVVYCRCIFYCIHLVCDELDYS